MRLEAEMFAKIEDKLLQIGPKLLEVPARLTPFSLQKRALEKALAEVFKEALEDEEFEFLSDKWLEVEVTDLHLSWFISYQQDKLVVSQANGEPDVRFCGNLHDLLLMMGRQEDPDTLFFQRRLKIEGDTELGLELKNLLDATELESLPPMLQNLLTQGTGRLKLVMDRQQA